MSRVDLREIIAENPSNVPPERAKTFLASTSWRTTRRVKTLHSARVMFAVRPMVKMVHWCAAPLEAKWGMIHIAKT